MKKRILKAILAISMFSICGCSIAKEAIENIEFSYPSYDNADSYAVGEFTYDAKDVQSVVIDWCVGPIEVTSTDGKECKVEEKAEQLDESYKLRWLIEDGVLTIKYCESNFKGTLEQNEGKALHIQIPEGIDLTIDNDTGSITLNECKTLSCIIQNEVGELSVNGLSTNTLNCSVAVGSVTMNDLFCKEGIVETDTGDIDIVLQKDIGMTVHYETEVGKYNEKDHEGTDVIQDGANDLYVSSSVGSITVK